MSYFFKVFKEFIPKLPGGERIRYIYRRFIRYRNPRIFWDKWSTSYDDNSYVSSIFNNDLWTIEKIKQIKAKRTLEVGCGTGRSLKLLVENFNIDLLVGVDFSYEMCKKASAKLKGVLIVNAYAWNLPFKNNSFDCVYTHGCLMHIPKRKFVRKAISEIKRVTKKYIILVEEIPPENQHFRIDYSPNGIAYWRDYKSFLNELSLKIVEEVTFKNKETTIGLVAKKWD